MGSKQLGFLVIAGALVYVLMRHREGKPLSGLGDTVIDSAIPWFGIKNPIVREIIKTAGKKFTRGTMGETLDVEFVKM